MLAVLARKYDWTVDFEEPLKTFPLPYPAWGLPMTFTMLSTADISLSPAKPLAEPKNGDAIRHTTGQAALNFDARPLPRSMPAYRVSC